MDLPDGVSRHVPTEILRVEGVSLLIPWIRSLGDREPLARCGVFDLCEVSPSQMTFKQRIGDSSRARRGLRSPTPSGGGELLDAAIVKGK